MGKSVSSSKNKRSRDSSQSRSRKRIKSRVSKSKRLRRVDDSESSSSESFSSSSSEDDYRRQKSRSRTRKKVKQIKKRSRGRTYSSDSSEDSRDLKKKKILKRKKNYESKKRTRRSKKPRKDASSSSASSESCSTCHSSDEKEFERKKGGSERRDKDRKRSDKVKSASKRNRDRSRSCSLSSRSSESDDYQYEEKFMDENNAKRLRSVIVVAKDDFGDGENKEEIVYDHDEYPSCRSNDSNTDGGSKREFEHYNHVRSEEKLAVEYEKEEEAVTSGARFGESETRDVVKEKNSQISVPGDDLKGEDDLESVLRKRALENLKRFRGGLPKNTDTSVNQKNRSDDETIPLTIDCESRQIKPSNSTDREIASSSQDQQVGDLTARAKLVANVGSCTNKQKLVRSVWRRESSDLSSGAKQATELMSGVNVDTGVIEAFQTLTKKNVNERIIFNEAPQDRLASNTQKEKVSASSGSCPNTTKLVRSVWRRESSNLGDRVDSGGPKTSQAKASEACEATDELCSSQAKTEPGQDKTKEGSQFEQKTMSVMRGGEMVQVSYKVYIPKKTPALARRVLKR